MIARLDRREQCQYVTGMIPTVERFMSKVTKLDNGCWKWTGATKSNGYGSFMMRSYVIDYAHRASWMIHRGPIPDGLYVCHSCDNRSCVNPDHLFLGSQRDNIHDMVAKGRIGNRQKTPEHRAKLSAALKGRRLSAAHKRNISLGFKKRREAVRA